MARRTQKHDEWYILAHPPSTHPRLARRFHRWSLRDWFLRLSDTVRRPS